MVSDIILLAGVAAVSFVTATLTCYFLDDDLEMSLATAGIVTGIVTGIAIVVLVLAYLIAL